MAKSILRAALSPRRTTVEMMNVIRMSAKRMSRTTAGATSGSETTGDCKRRSQSQDQLCKENISFYFSVV